MIKNLFTFKAVQKPSFFLMFYVFLTLFLLSFSIKADPNLPGGEGSVKFHPFPSYFLPVSNLPENKRKYFHAGKALAHQPWVKAPSSTIARDGLGPIYNARTCLACHANGGRGIMPRNGKERLVQGLVRISIPGVDNIHGVVPEPTYGDQIQTALALIETLPSVPSNQGFPANLGNNVNTTA